MESDLESVTDLIEWSNEEEQLDYVDSEDDWPNASDEEKACINGG